MLAFPDIYRLKFMISNKPRRGRLNSAKYPKNFTGVLGPVGFVSKIIRFNNNNNNKNSYERNKNSHNSNNFSSVFILEKEKNNLNKNLKNQISMNNPNEKVKTEREIIPNILVYKTKIKNKNSILTFRSNYNNIKKIFTNKQVDINIFLKEINSFLLPNNKTFENLQNLINYKIMNKESSKNYIFSNLLKRGDLPINKFKYGIFYNRIIKNTFKEALKKAYLNKALTNKKDIKEEYQRQLNQVKEYLTLHNKANQELNKDQNVESVILNNNCSSSLLTNLSENKNIINRNKMNLEKHKRNRKIIQNNSSDNIRFHLDNYNKKNINSKNKEINNKNGLLSLPDKIKFNKESFDNIIQKEIFKTKLESLREKKLKNIIQKQKKIIEDYIKIKEKIKNSEDYSIKTEISFQDNLINGFNFFSNKKNERNNKNEDIINCINNSEKSWKFENSLTKEKISKNLFKENTIKERELDMNSVNSFDNKKLFNNSLNVGNESKSKDLSLQANNISILKNSFSQKSLLEENLQKNKELIKKKYSQLFDKEINQIKKEERKNDNNKGKIILNKKLFLKKKKTLNFRSFKDFLQEEYNEQKMIALNNKEEEKKISENNSPKTERLKLKKIINEENEKLLEENWEYQFNNFKSYINKLKNITKDEFIKDTIKFFKNSE